MDSKVASCGGFVTGFYGQYTSSLDAKGRCILPAKMRSVTDESGNLLLDGEIVLTKGLEGCLAIYPEPEWSAMQERLGSLSFTDKPFRSFSRRFYSSATPVTPDKNGRILIPGHLIKDANLEKELMVIGVNRWIEIWNPQLFKYYLDQNAGSYEEQAAQLFVGDGRAEE